MRVATFGGETEMRALLQSLYDIRGPGSEEQFQLAEAALLGANPVLLNLSKVRVGTMLRVPPVAAIKTTAEIQPLEHSVGLKVRAAQEQLIKLESALDASSVKQSDATKEMLELAKSTRIQALAKKEPLLKEKLPGVRKALETRLKALTDSPPSRKAAFNVLRGELERLSQLPSNGKEPSSVE
jgi:hypothetical protein